ncbi:MAG: 2,3-bisphosphoglycerate-independent phosphoglycerate mutase [Microgenomates group bacterium]
MKSVILIVLDGFGIDPTGPGNAIYLANPTNYNSYLYSYPNTTLKASGEAVGLPAGEVGNTEVGHLNLGAGNIVFQDLPRINMAIADGSFYKNQVLIDAVNHIKKTGGNFHLLGLIGEGSVHSHIEHLYALLYFAKENHLKNVYIHAITDGRDSPPRSAVNSISQLEEKLKQNGVGKIATIMGRYFAMDRDRRWERTEKAYFCLTKGVGNRAKTAIEAVKAAYSQGKTDEFIEPTNIIDDKPTLIKEGDAVIFFNYRIDRPRQLTKAFVLDDFEKQANISFSFDPYAVKYYKTHYPQEMVLTPPFKRGEKIKNLYFATMTEYEKDLPVKVIFPPTIVAMPLGRVLSENGIFQLRMAESEKERFVTFYFNGQRENPFPLEERLIIPSPKVPTYDLKPEMSAYEMTNLLIEKIKEEKYPFILINFANPDMVGHTGNIQATILAIKTIDNCLGRIVQEGLAFNSSIIITADHGNAEQKINPQTGEVSTEHTNNPVPFIFIDSRFQGRFQKLQTGILADVAPTVLSLLDIPKPEQMTGRNLLEELK